MQDYRYYYDTKANQGRRRHRSNPAYRVEMARWKAVKLRSTIAEIEHSIMALERSIEAEQELAGVDDRRSLAYPTPARAMEARLENLRITRAALVSRLSSLEELPVALEVTA